MLDHILNLVMAGLVVGLWTTFIVANVRYQPGHPGMEADEKKKEIPDHENLGRS